MKTFLPLVFTIELLAGCVAPVPINTNTAAIYPAYLPVYTPQMPRIATMASLPVPIMNRPPVVRAAAKALPLSQPAPAVNYKPVTAPARVPQALAVTAIKPGNNRTKIAKTARATPQANLIIPTLSSTPSVPATQPVAPVGRIQDLNWLAQRILRNQTNGETNRLIQWNERGNFAALGLGQFIWYPAGKRGQYAETFPEFLNYAKANSAPVPAWIAQRPTNGGPWANANAFQRAQGDQQMQELRRFLQNTLNLQANFMAARLQRNMPQLVNQLPANQRQKAFSSYQSVVKTPGGLYPLLDYAQFKGEGSNTAERYNGKGWGLLQVLQTMETVPPGPGALAEFMRAADDTLVTRIANAPLERREARLLDGWLTRINTYRPQRRASR